MAKKEFSWDSEVEVGRVDISEKERRIIKFCSLKEKSYVAILKEVLLKGEWKIIANATFPMNSFSQIAEIVQKHEKGAVSK